MDLSVIAVPAVLVLVCVAVLLLTRSRPDADESEGVAEGISADERVAAAAGDMLVAEQAAHASHSAASSGPAPGAEVNAMHDETNPNEARPETEERPSTPVATPTSGTGGAPEPVLASHSISAGPTTQASVMPEPWRPAPTTPPSATWSAYKAEQPPLDRGAPPSRLFGMGMGTLAMVGSAVGGAWYYRHWQRERNKPINRLRRRVRSLAKAAGERMPDRAEIMERLPDRDMARPMGGVGTGMLLLALLAARAMRSGRDADEPEVAHLEVELARNGHHDGSANGHDASFWERLPLSTLRREDMAARGGELLSTARERVQTMEMPASRSAGLGVGGAMALAALGYLVWRLLNGGESDLYQGWHPEATSGDVIRNP